METCGLALPSKFSVSHPLNCSSWSISILLDYKKWFKSYFALFYQEASLCPLMPLIPRRNSFADCHEQAGVRHSQESRAHHMEWLLRKTNAITLSISHSSFDAHSMGHPFVQPGSAVLAVFPP